MAESVQVWVKTSIIESILNPNAPPHTRRLGMHGSLCTFHSILRLVDIQSCVLMSNNQSFILKFSIQRYR